MGPGFKYHVVTISAIFFALTVGLIVGSLFLSPLLAASQLKAVRNLQDLYKTDIQVQRPQLDQYRTFVAEALPSLLKNRLAHKVVAVVQAGDYSSALPPIKEALEMAGARVEVITIGSSLDRSDELLTGHLIQAQADDPRVPADRAALMDTLARILASGTRQNPEALTVLERAKLAFTDGESDYSAAANFVVIVGGSRLVNPEKAQNVYQPLTVAFQNHGLAMVACEPDNAAFSDMQVYRGLHLDVGTVDNVNTDIGRCALVYALFGDKDDYGIKATAKRLMPSLTVKSSTP